MVGLPQLPDLLPLPSDSWLEQADYLGCTPIVACGPPDLDLWLWYDVFGPKWMEQLDTWKIGWNFFRENRKSNVSILKPHTGKESFFWVAIIIRDAWYFSGNHHDKSLILMDRYIYIYTHIHPWVYLNHRCPGEILIGMMILMNLMNMMNLIKIMGHHLRGQAKI